MRMADIATAMAVNIARSRAVAAMRMAKMPAASRMSVLVLPLGQLERVRR